MLDESSFKKSSLSYQKVGNLVAEAELSSVSSKRLAFTQLRNICYISCYVQTISTLFSNYELYSHSPLVLNQME